MRNLIKEDLDRILRKKSIWIHQVLILARVAASVYFDVLDAPEKGAAFAVFVSDSISYIGLIIGFVPVLSVYADDYRMNLSDFMIGNIPGGLMRFAGLIAVYLGCAILAAALVFKRKELDF